LLAKYLEIVDFAIFKANAAADIESFIVVMLFLLSNTSIF